MTTKKRNWQERTPEFHTFSEEGSEVQGALTEVSSVVFGDNTVGKYTLRNDQGLVSFLGTTQLDGLMAGVIPGTYIAVKYAGEAQTRGGQKVKTFRLFVDTDTEPTSEQEAFPTA